MPAYSYHCLASDGSPRDGVLSAPSLDSARTALQQKGWRILQLKPTVAESAPVAVRRSQVETKRPPQAAETPLAAPIRDAKPPKTAPRPAPESVERSPSTTRSRYAYQALDSAGKPRDGVLLAVSTDDARRQLTERNLKVLVLRSLEQSPVRQDAPSARREAPAPRSAPGRLEGPNRREASAPREDEREPSARLSLRRLNLFTLQLGVMANAGISYFKALSALAQSDDLKLAHVCNVLADRIHQGYSLSAAMATMPVTFDGFYVKMIRVGEKTGIVIEVLRMLDKSLSREERNRTRISGALAYPAFILAASGLMVAFLVYYMLPGYLSLFKQTGAQLPAVTKLLMLVSSSPLPLILAVLPVLTVALILWGAPYHPLPRHLLNRLLYDVPLVREVFRRAMLIRISRNLAVMMQCGVSVIDAIDILMNPPTGYAGMNQSLHTCRERLVGGASLAESMSNLPAFPAFLTQAVTSGEQVGKVPHFLERWSDMMEEELDYKIETFIQALEPAMLLVMGLLVGFIVLAAFLPVFSILETL